jgi:glycine oxidase
MHHQHRASADVAIVGGGVIGLAAAWRAAARGLSVIVLERGAAGGGTSRFAAGMLAPISEADPSEQPLLALGIRAARAYPAFVAALAEASPLDPGYLRCGTIVGARDADEAEALGRAFRLRKDLGLPARRLRPSEARRLEPALAPTLRLALEFPEDHVIDPRALCATLADAARRAGATIREGVLVADVVCGEDRARGVRLADGELIEADHVLVAAGVWSGALGGLPEHARMPVRPVKGQILRLHDPAGPGLLNHVLRMEGGYVVPRGDGRYVIGATMEERGFDETVTAGALFGLLRDSSELLPGVSELVIDELSAGFRPGTPDNAPIIGAGTPSGLHWATGHYRHGILLAPVTAELVLHGLVGQGDPEWPAGGSTDEAAESELSRFAPARFAPTLEVTR